MPDKISRIIDDDEVLVRYLFSRDFKKGNIDFSKIIDKDVYVDTRGGVSLQRLRYCSESECKQRAKNNDLVYVGFLIFSKKIFNVLLEEHRVIRNDFNAIIESTPLDENNQTIGNQIDVFDNTPVNPSHADLIYINPACIPGDESPHTFTRIFSKNLFKQSEFIIDEYPEDEDYIGIPFTSFY